VKFVFIWFRRPYCVVLFFIFSWFPQLLFAKTTRPDTTRYNPTRFHIFFNRNRSSPITALINSHPSFTALYLFLSFQSRYLSGILFRISNFFISFNFALEMRSNGCFFNLIIISYACFLSGIQHFYCVISFYPFRFHFH
jgi:hypothetical protein